MRARRSLLLGLFFLALPAAACSCDEDPLTPRVPGTCEPSFPCPVGFEYRLGECRAARCQVDDDCCPGQKCNAAAGFCADQFVACTDDTACEDVPGQTCIEFRGGRFCGYPNLGNALSQQGTQPCVTNGDCDDDRTCFGGRCVVYAPCEGGCPSGQICDVDSNTCFAMAECALSCAPGQMLVVADPDNSSGPACCKVDCACATLPPVGAGQVGWYASVALPPDEVAVAAYDAIYGDLVVTRFDRTGAKKGVQYVDGFPTDGPIVANPDGPRGGRDLPGNQVGEHASIAVDASGTLHVAYYDRTLGQLRYANDSGDLWKTSVVDVDGNVGLYTSIAIGPDGNPHIAYMMVEGTIAPDPMKRSGLKLASARVSYPSASSDWSVEVVDSRVTVPPVCNGGCGMGEACVDVGAGPVCTAISGNCPASCASSEACVDVDGTASCVEKTAVLPIDDLYEGTGLFASLAFTSAGTPMIAYYDRVDGDLRLATGRAGGGFDLRTLDGDSSIDPADVGAHASLAIGPGDVVGVAYFDATHDDLVYLEVDGVREVVDTGVTPPDLRAVGADASLVYDASGFPAVTYQDPTNIDLLYARRSGNPAMWSTEVLRGAPPPGSRVGTAAGFYASQKRDADKVFITNVDVDFDQEGNLLLDLVVLVKELF
ncbi:hypothetical protein L6R52_18815 [Myxococcota bacterium]|nr:hypothetical protein [Myxococcota bacterium]